MSLSLKFTSSYSHFAYILKLQVICIRSNCRDKRQRFSLDFTDKEQLIISVHKSTPIDFDRITTNCYDCD
jgi:hypothetical protein